MFKRIELNTLTVWKFVFESADHTIEIPKGAMLLSVHEQLETICLWALVDPNVGKESRRFLTIGTGHTVPKELSVNFIGSLGMRNWQFVFHIFEVLSPKEVTQ